jgi:Zn-dependent protease with chaperone function
MRSLLVLALAGYVIAVLAAGPRWLLRTSWTAAAPRTAIAAWLALEFSVLMAALQAAATIELPMLPPGLSPAALRLTLSSSLQLQYHSVPGAAAGAVAAAFLIFMTWRVSWHAVRAVAAARAARARHAAGLTLVARPGTAPRSLVLEDDRPAVYCLPGLRRIVMTTGAISRLTAPELDAVLGHERAHLAGRHHLAVTYAAILAAAFPGARLFTAGAAEVSRLVELAADDAGSRQAGKVTLAQALFTLAAATMPGDALGASGSAVAQRIRRLIEPPAAATAAQRAAIHATRGAAAAATTFALTAAPTVAVLAGCCWARA